MFHVRQFVRWSVSACLAAPLFSGVVMANPIPSRQNIAQAKQAVQQATAIVQALINRSQGGGDGGGDGHGPGPQQCETIRDQRTCNGTPGCTYQVLRNGRYGRCVTAHDGPAVISSPDVVENDQAAGFALQGIGGGLFRLGEVIDQMNATWGTSQFYSYWQTACFKSQGLFQANQAGKVAAQLPPIGLITPADFFPIDTEIQAVRTQLYCQ